MSFMEQELQCEKRGKLIIQALLGLLFITFEYMRRGMSRKKISNLDILITRRKFYTHPAHGVSAHSTRFSRIGSDGDRSRSCVTERAKLCSGQSRYLKMTRANNTINRALEEVESV